MWSYRKEIHKIHAIPVIPDPSCSLGMDVAFLVDYTGSMGIVIQEVKNSIADITAAIVNQVTPNNYRLSLILSDETQKAQLPTYNSSTDYTSLPANQKIIRTDGPTTNQYTTAMEVFGTLNNEAEFTVALNKINTAGFPIGSGVGGPEPLDEALHLIVNQSLVNNFKVNVAKYLLLFTDNLPSGNDDIYNGTDDARMTTLTQNCIDKGIKVIVLGEGANIQVYKDIATNTGGSWNTSYDGAVISSQLIAGCTDAIPPTALAGSDQSIPVTDSSISLDGSSSYDSDGTLVSYLWELQSGPAGSTITTPNASTTTVTGIAEGDYEFKLTVIDNDGLQDTDFVSIQVTAEVVVVMTSYSYEGIYELNDPAHPNGGSLDYVDINGITQSLTFMWNGNCQTFDSQSAPTNTVAVATCIPEVGTQYELQNGAGADATYSYQPLGGGAVINTFMGGFETLIICAVDGSVSAEVIITVTNIGTC